MRLAERVTTRMNMDRLPVNGVQKGLQQRGGVPGNLVTVKVH